MHDLLVRRSDSYTSRAGLTILIFRTPPAHYLPKLGWKLLCRVCFDETGAQASTPVWHVMPGWICDHCGLRLVDVSELDQSEKMD